MKDDDSSELSAVQRLDPSSPIYAPLSPSGVSLCRGCQAAARCRLGLQSEHLTADGTLVSEIQCPEDQQGGPRVAHGGWTAGVLDELAGHVLVLPGEFVVTGTLTVIFVRPVPVEWPLIGRSWITRRDGRRVFVSATLELADTGEVLANADAIMVKRPAEHFAKHEQWLDTQRAKAAHSEHDRERE
jgi:acyl-coenzyme A thioesterase PaaI-like protein